MLKSKGPNTEPCGRLFQVAKLLFMLVLWYIRQVTLHKRLLMEALTYLESP